MPSRQRLRDVRVEGRITGIRYSVPADRTPLEISRNDESALKVAGAEVQRRGSRLGSGGEVEN